MQDMLERGASLALILAAGQWRSAAFMRYLESSDIETVRSLVGALGPVTHEFGRAQRWRLHVIPTVKSGSIRVILCPGALSAVE